MDGLDPELADTIRDAWALARCALEDDRDGARVILAALSGEGGDAVLDVAWLLSMMTAGMMHKHFGPDAGAWLESCQRSLGA